MATELITKSALLSCGESGIFQTAKAAIFSPNNENSATAQLLFDSGSQRSFITEEMVRKLKLEPRSMDKLFIATFSSSESKKFESPLVDLRIKLIDGTFLDMSANMVKTVVNGVKRMPLVELKTSLCNNLVFADTIPTAPEILHIDLLIGTDYYGHLVTGQKGELSPELFVIGSKLGWLLTGRGRIDVSLKENSMKKETPSREDSGIG